MVKVINALDDKQAEMALVFLAELRQIETHTLTAEAIKEIQTQILKTVGHIAAYISRV